MRLSLFDIQIRHIKNGSQNGARRQKHSGSQEDMT
jgi:hypothetical protein